MWLHAAVRICSLVAVLVNYAICVSCHSRHQLAPLSRLYIWTASNLVLCSSEHDVNLSWLDWKRGSVHQWAACLLLTLGLEIKNDYQTLCLMIANWNGIHHCCLIMWKKWYSMTERKDILSGMHLDFLITRHLCKAKPYLNNFHGSKMNELSLNRLHTCTVAQHIHKG